MNKQQLNKFRSRWRRWLGNKTRRGKPYYLTLLDSNWLGWVDRVYQQFDLEYKQPGFLASREEIKALYLTAINMADMDLLQKLDSLFAAELAEAER